MEKVSGGETMEICRESKRSNLSLHKYKVIDLILDFQRVQQTPFHPEKLGYTHLCGFRLNANSWRLCETRLWVSCKKPKAQCVRVIRNA